MGRIPEETILAIRERVDVADLIGRHVTLRKAGRSYKGLCPFHEEKTPSFSVNSERGFFHCFGCGVSGNAFDFLIRHENLTFPEAVRSLAAECGVEVPETSGGDSGQIAQVLAANEIAQKLYRAALASPAGAAARSYLAGRGIDDAGAESFAIGLAPDRWDAVASALARERVPAALGERAGLLKQRDRGGHYDLLRNRITFPICDVRGRVVAFGGRALGEDQEPKYLNSPESPVFRKREAFYGFPEALEPIRRADRAVVVEGYFDQIALRRAGLGEAVATCGTALGEDHARNLRRRTRHVVLLFDGDEAGQRAALRGLSLLLPHGLRVRAAALPPGMDPDDFLAAEGPEALRALVDTAPPALELAIQRAVVRGCGTPWEKADAVAAVTPLLVALPDAVERGAFAQRLALAAGVAPRDVEAAMRGAVRGEAPSETLGTVRPRLDTTQERHLGDLVRILLTHPAHAARLDEPALAAVAAAEPWAELLPALLDRCRKDVSADVYASLEGCLSGAALDALRALAAESPERFEDPEVAERALDDISSWFARRESRARQRALTDQLRNPSADRTSVLLEKNQELARRREAAEGGPPS